MRSLNFTIVFHSVNSDQPGILYTAVIAENVGSWTLSWTLRIVWISIDIFRAFSSLICKKPLSLLNYNFDFLIHFLKFVFFSESTKMFFFPPPSSCLNFLEDKQKYPKLIFCWGPPLNKSCSAFMSGNLEADSDKREEEEECLWLLFCTILHF